MAVAKSVRVIIDGEYVSGNFVGEIFQFGFSLTASDSGGDVPPVLKAPLPSFAVTETAETHTIDDFVVDVQWLGNTRFTFSEQVEVWHRVKTFAESLKGLMYTSMVFKQVRLIALDEYNKVIAGANRFEWKVPMQGTGQIGVMPPQLAVVASFQTGARGPSGRGRAYTPFLNVAASGGVVGTSERLQIVNAYKAMFEGIWTDISAIPSVVSARHSTYSSLTVVRVGALWDTQRKRKNALNEIYTDAPLSY